MSERRLLIQPHDLRGIIVTCGNCSSGMSLPLDGGKVFPNQCPHCKTGFRTSATINTLQEALRDLRTGDPGRPARVELELPEA